MSKKHKCINCENHMKWALPVCVTKQNIEYAKQCIRMAELTCVCGLTQRTKRLDQEQYCNHFKLDKVGNNDDTKDEILTLRRMIEEYEMHHRDWKDNFMGKFTQLK